MRLVHKLTTLLSIGAAALAWGEDWNASVSLKDSWRWTELESLDEYQIANAQKGADGELWFAHLEGLLRYDGLEVVEFPYEEMPKDRIGRVTVSSEGDIFMLSNQELVIFQGDRYLKIHAEGENYFLKDTELAEYRDGRMIVATSEGLYEIVGNELRRIDSDLGIVDSLLVDSEDRLWAASKEDSQIKVFDIVEREGGLATELIYAFEKEGRSAIAPVLHLDLSDRVWVIDPDEDDRCYGYENYRPSQSIEGIQTAGLMGTGLVVAEVKSDEMWFCVNRRAGRYKAGELQVFDIEEVAVPSYLPYLVPFSNERLLVGGLRAVPQVLDLSDKRWRRYEDLNYQCADQDGTRWFLSVDRKVVSLLDGEWRAHDRGDLIDTPNRLLLGSDGSLWASGAHQGQAAVSLMQDGKWDRYTYPNIGGNFSHLGTLETKDGLFIFGGGTPQADLGGAVGGAAVFQKRENTYQGRHFAPPVFTERTANIVERGEEGLLFGAGSLNRGFSNGMFSAESLDLFPSQWIDHMIVDQYDDLWVACMGVGVYRLAGVQSELHGSRNGLDTKKVIYLLEDEKRGGVLALTEEGFYRYDGKSWGRFGFSFDLPLKRENHTVFSDDEGAVWVNFSSRSWFLEHNGFEREHYRFQTLRYVPEEYPPETKAMVSGDRFPEGGQVQVDFEGVDFWDQTPKRELVYSWSDDGKQWSEFFEDTSVTLNGESSGEYSVYVRARDAAGNVDLSPAVVHFSVFPPLWKRAWFIVLSLSIVSGFVGLIIVVFKFRVKSALAIEEFKLDIFSNISHELRNPLAVILAPVERMLRSEEEQGKRRDLEVVLRSARKMQEMVDQLLDFRKVDKGRLELSPSGGELISFVREAVQNLEPLWVKKEQHVEFSSDPNSCLCSFDSEVLQKIVDNLVSNAIKYSEEGMGIYVEVTVEQLGGWDELILIVEDEGVGIPIHEQDNILKPFYRISQDGAEEGSGVGLALVSQLVQLWGGTIAVKSAGSKGGKGTRFIVKLPLDKFEDSSGLSLESGSEEKEDEGLATLLLVEDNEDFRYVVSKELSGAYRILESGDGSSGFEIARKDNPDLIVSDVMMPGIDGYELSQKLKSHPETSHIPVILLTAKSSNEHRVEGIKAGADAYIAKPFEVEHLKVRISNLLETRKELKLKFAKQLMFEPAEIAATPTDELILKKALEVVEDHMNEEEFDLERFGSLMSMSRSTLNRKLKGVTGESPQAFVRKMRLKRAASLLQSGALTVSEVAEKVGILDLSYFGKIFRKEFCVSPSAYKDSKSA